MHATSNGPNFEAVLSYVESGHIIIGIDEVGRGAWAGPVVASAVILDPTTRLTGVQDSKRMTHVARVRANRYIRANSVAVGLGWVHAHEVDTFGLSWAIKTSGLRALNEVLANFVMPPAPMIVVLDGKHNYLMGSQFHSIAIVEADATILPVAAASVVAKVARDSYMAQLSHHLPYGFDRHKGYGSPAHIEALARHGVSKHHRASYAPIARLLATSTTQAIQ